MDSPSTIKSRLHDSVAMGGVGKLQSKAAVWITKKKIDQANISSSLANYTHVPAMSNDLGMKASTNMLSPF